MQINYCIVEYVENGISRQTVFESSKKDAKPCCDQMFRELSKPIVKFDENEPILYLSPSEECDYEDHTTIDLRFCPYCGKEIKYVLTGRIRRVRKSRTVTSEELEYYYEETSLPV